MSTSHSKAIPQWQLALQGKGLAPDWPLGASAKGDLELQKCQNQLGIRMVRPLSDVLPFRWPISLLGCLPRASGGLIPSGIWPRVSCHIQGCEGGGFPNFPDPGFPFICRCAPWGRRKSRVRGAAPRFRRHLAMPRDYQQQDKAFWSFKLQNAFRKPYPKLRLASQGTVL